jgi:hypothetical protein
MSASPHFEYRYRWLDAEVSLPLRAQPLLRIYDRLAGLAEEAVTYRIREMRRSFPDAEVRGYETLIASMTCDPKDRHVLAAAVRGDAEALGTFNTRDFPDTATAV